MKKIIYGVLAFAPVFALAQTTASLGTISELVKQGGLILKALIPLAYGLAILYFFYGVAKFVSSAGDEKKKGEGRQLMIYGVVAIFVITSVFGLVAWLQTTFGINPSATGGDIQLPTITTGL